MASGRIPLEGTRVLAGSAKLNACLIFCCVAGTKLEIVTETEFTIVAEYRSFELSAESEAEAKV